MRAQFREAYNLWSGHLRTFAQELSESPAVARMRADLPRRGPKVPLKVVLAGIAAAFAGAMDATQNEQPFSRREKFGTAATWGLAGVATLLCTGTRAGVVAAVGAGAFGGIAVTRGLRGALGGADRDEQPSPSHAATVLSEAKEEGFRKASEYGIQAGILGAGGMLAFFGPLGLNRQVWAASVAAGVGAAAMPALGGLGIGLGTGIIEGTGMALGRATLPTG